MKFKVNLQFLTVLIFLFTASMSVAKEYIIFSIVQDIPMGTEGEVVKKNYYVNIGGQQGVKEGSILDVYRTISRVDPYSSKQRYNYKMKIGQLKVLHTEDTAAIGILKQIKTGEDAPLYEIDNFMIGDIVSVNTGR